MFATGYKPVLNEEMWKRSWGMGCVLDALTVKALGGSYYYSIAMVFVVDVTRGRTFFLISAHS